MTAALTLQSPTPARNTLYHTTAMDFHERDEKSASAQPDDTLSVGAAWFD